MPQTSPSVHICKYYFILSGGKESKSYWISTKEEGALVSLLLVIWSTSPGLGELFPGKNRDVSPGAWGMLPQAAPSLSLGGSHPSAFPPPFFFLSRFPDSGLKMKRKSYCLITTAVTSIKCYLKVNGLHMLKTLELLTDHCKVSRIFNNLRITRSATVFSARQAVSPGSLCWGSQQKLLLHSLLQHRNKAVDSAKHQGPWVSFEHSRNPYFPYLKWTAGMAGGLLKFEEQQRVPDPPLELSLEHRHGKDNTAPTWRQGNPSKQCPAGALQGTPCLGADLGQVAAKCCWDQGGRQLLFLCSCSFAPAPIPSLPWWQEVLLKTGKGNIL